MNATMFLVDGKWKLLGFCSLERNGWMFFPAVASRRAEFRAYQTVSDAIPAWAIESDAFLLSEDEWRSRKSRV